MVEKKPVLQLLGAIAVVGVLGGLGVACASTNTTSPGAGANTESSTGSQKATGSERPTTRIDLGKKLFEKAKNHDRNGMFSMVITSQEMLSTHAPTKRSKVTKEDLDGLQKKLDQERNRIDEFFERCGRFLTKDSVFDGIEGGDEPGKGEWIGPEGAAYSNFTVYFKTGGIRKGIRVAEIAELPTKQLALVVKIRCIDPQPDLGAPPAGPPAAPVPAPTGPVPPPAPPAAK